MIIEILMMVMGIFFLGSYRLVKRKMNKPPKRSEEETQKVVYELQMGFLESFISEKPIDPDIIIDTVLGKYEKFNYNEVYKKERIKKATRQKT